MVYFKILFIEKGLVSCSMRANIKECNLTIRFVISCDFEMNVDSTHGFWYLDLSL